MKISYTLLIILLVGCRTMNPSRPIIADKIPTAKTERPISVIDIPVTIDLSSLNLRSAIPNTFYSPNYPKYVIQKLQRPIDDEHIDYRYDITVNNIDFNLLGNGIHVNSTFHLNDCEALGCAKYVAGICLAAININCPNGTLTTEVSAQLNITPTYSFKLTNITPTFQTSPCAGGVSIPLLGNIPVGIFSFIIVPKVTNLLTQEIDAKIGERSFMQKATEIWSLVNKTFIIDKDVTMNLNPKGFRVSQINGTNKVVNFSIGLNATPEIRYGKQKELPLTPLPPLEISSPGNGYNLAIDLLAEYSSIDSAAEELIKGKRFDIDNTSYINAKKCLISGNANHNTLVIRVMGSGKIKGIRVRKINMYLTGSPTLDVPTQQVRLSQVKYDISTSNFFLNLGLNLEKSQIKELITESAKVSLAKSFVEIKGKIEKQFNREFREGIINTVVNNISGYSIECEDKKLIFHTQCNGEMKILLSNPNF